MAARPRGKSEIFSSEQNEALRAELQTLLSKLPERERSQKGAAGILGVVQQTAGRYVNGDVGFGYLIGTRLARKAGFRGVDDLFEAHGVSVEGDSGEWAVRDTAVRLARERGIAQVIIDDVCAAHDKPRYQFRSVAWWSEEIRAAQEEQEAAQAEAARETPIPKSETAQTTTARHRRRVTG